MKSLRSFSAALGFAVLMGGVFAAASASAHDSPPNLTAKQAGEAGTEAAMRNFVLHAKLHYQESVAKDGTGAHPAFLRALRHGGDWNEGSTYLIVFAPRGNVRSHGKYTRSLYGTILRNLPPLKGFFERVLPPKAPPVCAEYERNGSKRWTCAVSFTSPFGAPFLLVGGFDHDENDPGIVQPACPPHEPPAVTAAQLDENPNRENLQKFVKESIRLIDDAFKKSDRPFGTVDCIYQDETWKSGQIYLYIMTSSTRVIVNGNNPELAGTIFRNILDEDGVDIGKRILATAPEPGKGGFVEYKWDNPAVEGDEIDEAGKSPGTSPKIAYVEAAKLVGFDPDDLFIFGSGYYPMPGMTSMTEVDTGCAVAGAGASSAGSVFGLFLAVFSICFVLCAKSRRRK